MTFALIVKKVYQVGPLGCGVVVGVTPACLVVAWFESCVLQKCYATTWIALTHPRVPHVVSTVSLSGLGQLSHVRNPFFFH